MPGQGATIVHTAMLTGKGRRESKEQGRVGIAREKKDLNFEGQREDNQ